MYAVGLLHSTRAHDFLFFFLLFTSNLLRWLRKLVAGFSVLSKTLPPKLPLEPRPRPFGAARSPNILNELTLMRECSFDTTTL